jgi:hypothetical protein
MRKNYKAKLKIKKYHLYECFNIKILNFKLNNKHQYDKNEKLESKNIF